MKELKHNWQNRIVADRYYRYNNGVLGALLPVVQLSGVATHGNLRHIKRQHN